MIFGTPGVQKTLSGDVVIMFMGTRCSGAFEACSASATDILAYRITAGMRMTMAIFVII